DRRRRADPLRDRLPPDPDGPVPPARPRPGPSAASAPRHPRRERGEAHRRAEAVAVSMTSNAMVGPDGPDDPPGLLRITPADEGSGFQDASTEHDRHFAEAAAPEAATRDEPT